MRLLLPVCSACCLPRHRPRRGPRNSTCPACPGRPPATSASSAAASPPAPPRSSGRRPRPARCRRSGSRTGPPPPQAWEERVGGGEARPEHWLALARALLQKTPPDPARALQAAWTNFQAVAAGPPEIAGLLVMAEALQRLDRPAQQLQALQAVLQRAPDNPRYRQMLAEARRAAGLLVAGINTEPEAEPARACLRFTVPPAKRTDWQPQDWVRAEPPVPGLAVLREGEQLCVAGLPHGPVHPAGAACRPAGRGRAAAEQGRRAARRHAATVPRGSSSMPAASCCRAARRSRSASPPSTSPPWRCGWCG